MLGAAAGGGFPQWNCSCANCHAARQGKLSPLTQSSVAVKGSGGGWLLINASPDLPAQIRDFPELQPSPDTVRNSPIAAVLLTNADLDHVLGLWSLREGGRLHVLAPRAVRDTLDHALRLSLVLDFFCRVDWHEPSEVDWLPVPGTIGTHNSLVCRAIRLPAGPPLFDQRSQPEGAHSVAYSIVDRDTGGRLLVAPDVGACPDALTIALREADAVLFDGTFWSGDELQRINPRARTAAAMGHLPIQDQSLPLLQALPARHKIYYHLNNTNPVLAPGSPERAAVLAAGLEVGRDGLEFVL